MGVFSVLNSHDSIEAKNLFAQQSEADVFSDVYYCTGVVHVVNAYLDEVYQGYGKLHNRELILEGELIGARIEDHDNRIFPCGSKELIVQSSNGKTPQSVRIHWVMSIEEKALVEGKGCTYDDFELPPNLIGNDIEIPMHILYKGIYESPIAAIEVLDAFDVYTCTRENRYFGFFDGCVESEHVKQQQLESYEFYPSRSYEDMYEPEYAVEDETIYEEGLESQTQEEVEDEESYAAVNELIRKQNEESEARRMQREAHAQDSKSIVSIVNAKLADAAKREQEDNQTNVWDTMYDDGKTENKAIKHKASYEDFKSAAMEFELKKAEEDKERSENAATTVDRAMDNILLNAGNTDISGYTTSDSQVQEKKDEMSGKKSADVARRQDIAADNMAMNAGITDIAGQGASTDKHVEKKKVDASAQALVANLFGLNPNDSQASKSDSDQQYL